MKILIVTPYGFRPHSRSFTDYVLARALVKAGHQVSAVTYRQTDDSSSERLDGIQVYRIRGYRGLYPALWRILLGQGWDVVHIFHQRNQMAPWATLLAKVSKTPVILSEWGLLHDPFLSENRDRPLVASPTYSRVVPNLPGAIKSVLDSTHNLPSALKSWWFHIPLYKSGLVLFLSEHNVKLASGLQLGTDRVQWVSHFFDDNLYSPPNSLPDSVASLAHPLVLFIGQLKLRKGFDILVQAAPRILAEFPTARFALVSSYLGNLEVLQGLLDKSGYSDRFVLFNNASNLEKDALLSIADVLVMPSRYEGFGIPVLEAFAAGCPVVTSDVVAISETIRHGENGWLVKPEDPQALAEGIITVLSSPQLRTRLVEGGRATLPNYRVERLLPQVIALYEEIRFPKLVQI
jgi:glycosyltransferase involved in cell wall biosynthesis